MIYSISSYSIEIKLIFEQIKITIIRFKLFGINSNTHKYSVVFTHEYNQ